MNKNIFTLVSAVLTLTIPSCRSKEHQPLSSSISSEASSGNINESKQNKSSMSAKTAWFAQYRDLIARKNYIVALKLVCLKFRINGCDDFVIGKFSKSDEIHNGVAATTTPYTNTITLYRGAFIFNGSTLHPGWLAAVIRHEQVHQNQSHYVRGIVAKFNPHFNAALEMEAWNAMLKYKDEYALTCTMIVNIHENIWRFTQQYERKQLESDAEMPMSQYRRIYNFCIKRRLKIQQNSGLPK
jgi:hypothetical protein